MTLESTKPKSVQTDKGDTVKTVHVVGRARFPVRKPGVWHLVGVYSTEKAAKAACYDKWCCCAAVKEGVSVNLTIALERGQVVFVNE